uniref:Endonuclease-reverse transcriptase n=1 Tax=Ascaris lumbricoides TaxID=6252 RepID=A0A0M3HW99_ASCLU
MERITTGIQLVQRKGNELRSVTKVKACVTEAGMRKFRWAALTSALKIDVWIKRIAESTARIGKRSRGRPAMRWSDSLKKTAGTNWIREALNRDKWKRYEETFIRSECSVD